MRKLFLLLLLSSLILANELKPKHILLLNSYNQSMTWVSDITKAVYDVLEPSKNNYILHIENMDTKRIYNQQHLELLAKTFKNKYHDIKFDLILTSDNNALEFLKKYRNDIFGKVPVSFSGVNFLKDSDLAGHELYTGITEEFDAVGTLNIALKLKPNTKEIFIINDYLTTGIAWKNSIKESLENFRKDIKITYSNDVSMAELQLQLSNLSEDAIVLLGAYFKDKNGTFFTYEKIAELLSVHSKVPVFCLLEFHISKGVVGGSVIGGYYQGEAMSKIGQKILDGVSISSIPIIREGVTKPVFNYDELIKHNLDVELLPKDSIIINQPINYFKKYKFLIISISIVIFLLIIIIGILLINIKQRHKSQQELKKSKEKIENLNKTLEKKVEKRTIELEKSNKELQKTIEDLKLAQNKLIESEKMASLGGLVAGVAHEMNTPIGVGLTGITHFLEITQSLKNSYESDNMSQEDFEKYLSTSTELAQQINTNLMRSAHLIKSFKQVAVDQTSEEKREFNIKSYFQEVVFSLNNIIKKTNIKIKIECDDNLIINSYPGAYSQILTNLIINSIKHAYDEKQEGVIIIEISVEEDSLKFIFSDDGKGIKEENLLKVFEPFYTTNRLHGGTGLGLNIIYNIVTTTLNGTIECQSQVGIGTTFIITSTIIK